ncbi:MAG: hypothetical protein ABFR19_04480 [Pseudomonadota bacterium]
MPWGHLATTGMRWHFAITQRVIEKIQSPLENISIETNNQDNQLHSDSETHEQASYFDVIRFSAVFADGAAIPDSQCTTA